MSKQVALSPLQNAVIALLRDRNCWWIAEAAEKSWQRGASYYLDPRLRCPRGLRSLFRRANAYAEREEDQP